jgi:hypothetical protein
MSPSAVSPEMKMVEAPSWRLKRRDAASTLIPRRVNDETKRAHVVWLLREN